MIRQLICILFSLLCCTSDLDIPSDIPNHHFYDCKLIGTWVIYDGGNVAPDVLQFDADGLGIAFHLPADYDETWLDGGALDETLLTKPNLFFWKLEMHDEQNGTLHLQLQNYRNREETLEYSIVFEEDMERTSLPGFCLSIENGGGGWLKVSTVSQHK